MISLQEFIQQYLGKTGQGNTPENMGQCVGLVSLWQDNLGVPHEYGNAKDLLTNANTSFFQVVINNPQDIGQFPFPGDIMVWGDTWGNGFGHCGIVVDATGTSFHTFEQNDITSADPTGACDILAHDYTGVLGWLHFTGNIPSDKPQGTYVDADTFSKLVHNSEVTDLLNDYFQLPHNSDWPVIRTKLDALVQQVKDAQAADQADQQKIVIDDKKVLDLTNAVNALNTQLEVFNEGVQKGLQSPTIVSKPSEIVNPSTTSSTASVSWLQRIRNYFGL